MSEPKQWWAEPDMGAPIQEVWRGLIKRGRKSRFCRRRFKRRSTQGWGSGR